MCTVRRETGCGSRKRKRRIGAQVFTYFVCSDSTAAFTALVGADGFLLSPSHAFFHTFFFFFLRLCVNRKPTHTGD